MRSLEDKMRPNSMSYAGFLGADEKLEDVLAMDDKTVKELGLTHEKIAQRLEYLVRKEMQILNDVYEKEGLDEMHAIHRQGVEIDGKYLVGSVSWMGSQDCPWDGSREYGSSDFTVTNKTTGERVRFPGLIIHLIKAHNFYEGKGTHYRLDPADAVRVLEIKPDEDYSLQIIKEKRWIGGSGTSNLNEDFIGSKEDIAKAERVIELEGGAKAYITGNNLWFVSSSSIDLKDPLTIDGIKVKLYENRIPRGQRVFHLTENERVIV